MLLERINVGGMAEVFKAKAFGVEGFERLVAVKRILPSIAEDTDFIMMFIDEAKIAVQLTHANIAQIFDLGKVNDAYFIAMEYVPGKDLRAIFDRGRKRGEQIPLSMACYSIMKICEGLDYAHNKKDATGRDLNLVHRDVSLQNLLASYDGEVKIIDFGIAKAAGKAGKTQAGILKGKFGYMSPEQVRGEVLDRRSDVFGVGICLYELLTGERLFVGESDFATLEKVRNVEIMPPSTYNKRVPEELERVVLRALAKDPVDRYQTAMDLHDDLQSFMYTSGNFFARKDMATFMKKTFAEEISRESARDEEYRKLDAKSLNSLSDLTPALGMPRSAPPGGHMGQVGQVGLAPPKPPGERSAPPPPLARGASAPPAPARGAPGPMIKQTMLGMPAAPPPPPPSTKPQPPTQQAASGVTLDMDWDDEELSTQIYDKPDALSALVAPPSRYQGTPSQPPSSPGSLSSAPPASQAAAPSLRPPESFAAAPASPPAARRSTPPGARDATAVTPRPTNSSSPAALFAVAVAAVAVIVAGASVYWFGFRELAGTIHVTTSPADARVLFDNRPVAGTSSPFVVGAVEPGQHVIEVRRDGYRVWSSQIDLQSGQTLTLPTVVLEPTGNVAQGGGGNTLATGALTLVTDPPSARVSVDGAPLAALTPLSSVEVVAGAHELAIELAGYQTRRQWVTITAGQSLDLGRVVLVKQQVAVTFSSVPDGATVVLVRGTERKSLGQTPVRAEIDGLAPWTVEMSMTGYASYSTTLVVPAGATTYEVAGQLVREAGVVDAPSPGARPLRVTPPRPQPARPQPVERTEPVERPEPARVEATGNGRLRINTRPWSQVFVDGRLIGNTPQMGVELSAGEHRVTLVNTEFNIRETITVNIRSGQTETRILNLTPSQ